MSFDLGNLNLKDTGSQHSSALQDEVCSMILLISSLIWMFLLLLFNRYIQNRKKKNITNEV